MKKKKAYSLIEVIIAMSLMAILVLTILPIFASTNLQIKKLEDQRIQNDYLENLILMSKKKLPIDSDFGLVETTKGINTNEKREIYFKDIKYTIKREFKDDYYWIAIERDGIDEKISILER